MASMGKLLILAGVVAILMGCFFLIGGKFFPLGRLPGDIRIEKGDFSFYFPLASCLIVSAILSLILWVFSRFK